MCKLDCFAIGWLINAARIRAMRAGLGVLWNGLVLGDRCELLTHQRAKFLVTTSPCTYALS